MLHNGQVSDPEWYFTQESEAERRSLYLGCKLNGQLMGDNNPLQVTEVVDLEVPDGFRMIIVPDSHGVPCYGVLRGIELFASRYRPHIVGSIGDWTNLAYMSRFTMNPYSTPAYSPGDEMNFTRQHLRYIMRFGGSYRMIALGGNHDDLVLRYLANNVPLLAKYVNPRTRAPLVDLVTNMLGFTLADPVTFVWGRGQRGGREGGIRFISEVRGGNLLASHGSAVDAVPARSAYKEWKRRFIRMIMGHVHRGGDFAYETVGGVVVHSIEIANVVDWLSSDFEYSPEHNWIHGFGVVEKIRGAFFTHFVPILMGWDERGHQHEYFLWRDQQNRTVEFPCYDV